VFPLQAWDRCVTAWGSYYFAPNLALLLVFAALSALPAPRAGKKKE
jgi:hypothetical protein